MMGIYLAREWTQKAFSLNQRLTRNDVHPLLLHLRSIWRGVGGGRVGIGSRVGDIVGGVLGDHFIPSIIDFIQIISSCAFVGGGGGGGVGGGDGGAAVVGDHGFGRVVVGDFVVDDFGGGGCGRVGGRTPTILGPQLGGATVTGRTGRVCPTQQGNMGKKKKKKV